MYPHERLRLTVWKEWYYKRGSVRLFFSCSGDKPMKTPICEMLGIDFPLVAFSHCRDVIASVSRAGGFGVLGVTAFTPDQLEMELKWIDDHIEGRPYGVDVLIPENLSIKEEKGITIGALAERIPQSHKDFVRNL